MLLTLTVSLIIMFVMLSIVGVVFDIFSSYFGTAYGSATITVGIIAFISFIFLMNERSNPAVPTAMDVYRGKTVLRITYEGDIATDTVVVFRSKR